MKAQTCWEHVKTAAREAEKPRSIQQKSMHCKRDKDISQKVGSASEAPTGALGRGPVLAEFRCMRGDARAAVRERERKRDGTQEVLPRTTTAPVVLKASADHTVAEFRRREEQTDRTAFSERQW